MTTIATTVAVHDCLTPAFSAVSGDVCRQCASAASKGHDCLTSGFDASKGDKCRQCVRDAQANGLAFFACSYGPRYGDATCTFVSLLPGEAEAAAEKAVEFDVADLPGYCDDPDCGGDCSLCSPDLCVWGESSFTSARYLFSVEELREHRQALRRGETVALYR